MAVSTQQFEIVFVGFPVTKATRPTVLSLLGRQLLVAINVINVQHTYIRVTAANTLSTESPDKLHLSFPIAPLFLQLVSVRIPKLLLALRGAKLCIRGATAKRTGSGVAPTMGVVARHGAELSISSVLRGVKRVTTVRTEPFRAILGSVGRDSSFTLVPGINRGLSAASHRAMDPGTLAVKLLSALRAGVHDLVHGYIIPQFINGCKLGYFAIAQRRIAQAQK